MAGAAVKGISFIKNAGTSTEQILSQISVPLQRFRVSGTSDVGELVRQFNLFVDAVQAATLQARSLPFAGPATYVVGYSFVSGKDARIAHRLQTANVRAWIGNKDNFADIKVVSVDDTFVTLNANADVTADIILLVTP